MARAPDPDGSPSDRDLSLGTDRTEQREEQLALTVTFEARHAEDLAFVEFEVDAVEAGLDGEPLDTQGDLVLRGRPALGIQIGQPTTEHHGHDPFVGQVADGFRANRLAVA